MSWGPPTSRSKADERIQHLERQNAHLTSVVAQLQEEINKLRAEREQTNSSIVQHSTTNTPQRQIANTPAASAASSRSSSPQRNPPAKKRPLTTEKDPMDEIKSMLEKNFSQFAAQIGSRIEALEARQSKQEAAFASFTSTYEQGATTSGARQRPETPHVLQHGGTA